MAAAASPATHRRSASAGGGAAAADQPLSLLHLPGDLLAHIVSLLDEDGSACDRMRLAGTCRTLRAASLRQPSWWRRLSVSLQSRRSTRALTAWLANYRPHITVLSLRHVQATQDPSYAVYLPSPPLEGLAELEVLDFPLAAQARVLARLAAHTGLTRLFLEVPMNDPWLIMPPTISSLSRLALLKVRGSDGELEHLSSLTQLLSLDFRDSCVDQLIPLAPHLRQLTSLSVSLYWDGEYPLPESVSLLTRLAELQLHNCMLPDQWPPVLAAAAAAGQRLTRLELIHSTMGRIPEEMASLVALQHFSYSAHRDLDFEAIAYGLQHMVSLPLTQLPLESHVSELPADFSRLTALQVLSLEGWMPNADEAGPAHLPQLGPGAALQHLALSGSRVPPPGPAWQCLSTLGSLTRLELLNVEGQEWPPVMSGLTALQQLQLIETFWCDGSWEPLAGLHQLTWMDVTLRRLTAAPLAVHNPPVRSCPPALQHLILNQHRTRQLPPEVARHSNLTHLELHGWSMRGLNLQHARWPALRSVALSYGAQPPALALAADLAALTSLELNCSPQLADEPAQCIGLCELQLRGFGYDNAGWEQLRSLQQLTALSLINERTQRCNGVD